MKRPCGEKREELEIGMGIQCTVNLCNRNEATEGCGGQKRDRRASMTRTSPRAVSPCFPRSSSPTGPTAPSHQGANPNKICFYIPWEKSPPGSPPRPKPSQPTVDQRTDGKSGEARARGSGDLRTHSPSVLHQSLCTNYFQQYPQPKQQRRGVWTTTTVSFGKTVKSSFKRSTVWLPAHKM